MIFYGVFVIGIPLIAAIRLFRTVRRAPKEFFYLMVILISVPYLIGGSKHGLHYIWVTLFVSYLLYCTVLIGEAFVRFGRDIDRTYDAIIGRRPN